MTHSAYSLAEDGGCNVVEFVALAEFDIDAGAVLRCRVPDVGGADSSFLCEQMLPDRSEGHAHQRTVFFKGRAAAPGSSSSSSSTTADTPPQTQTQPSVLRDTDVFLRVRTYRCVKAAGGGGEGDGGAGGLEDEGGGGSGGVTWVRTCPGTSEEFLYSVAVPQESQRAKSVRSRTVCELLVATSAERRADTVHSIPVTAAVGVRRVATPPCCRQDDERAPGTMLVLTGTGCGYDLGIDFLDSAPYESDAAQAAAAADASTEAADAAATTAASEATHPTDLDFFDAWLRGDHSLKRPVAAGGTSAATLRPTAAAAAAAAAPSDAAPASTGDAEAPFLYCLSVTRRRKDKSVRRGAIIKGISLGCRNPVGLYAFEGVLCACLERCLDLWGEGSAPVAQRSIVEALYAALNDKPAMGIAALAAVPAETRVSAVQHAVWRDVLKDERRGAHGSDLTVAAAPAEFTESFDVRVPLHMSEQRVCEEAGSLRRLLDAFKESSITLVNEVLCGRRVMLLSYQKSAGELCSVVMAAASLVLPVAKGYLSKVFPYSSLTCMSDWNQLPSCLVGVTNPMFEHRKEWWDVLCDLDSGKIKYGSAPGAGGAGGGPGAGGGGGAGGGAGGGGGGGGDSGDKDAAAEEDAAFLARLMQQRTQMEAAGGSPEDVEAFLRYQLRQHLQGDEARSEAAEERARRWREAGGGGGGGGVVAASPPPHLGAARTLLLRLRGKKAVTEEDAILIFQTLFKTIRSQDDLFRFISLMPPEADGLFPLALGLFHPSEAVQLLCVACLRRIDSVPEGKLFMHTLNPMLLIAYDRKARQFPPTH